MPNAVLITTKHRHFRLTPVTFQEYGAAVADEESSEIVSVDPRVTNAIYNLLALAQMTVDNMEEEGFDVDNDVADLDLIERLLKLEE
jgi:hypothetical protein